MKHYKWYISIFQIPWCFPDVVVDAGGVFPPVFRHPLDGKSFAAERVGQQPLQGFRLTAAASLRCLYNPNLKPLDLTLDAGPVDPLPVVA